MRESTFRTLSLAAVVVAMTLSGLPAQVSAPASVPFVSAATTHRAILPPDSHLLELLGARQSLLRVEHYGSFVFVVIDEAMAGGRGALLALGLELCDEEAVIGFDAAPLDTADVAGTAALLSSIPQVLRGPDLRLDAPWFGRDLLVVQFIGPVKDAWLDRLDLAGGRVVSPLASNAFIVSVEGEARAAVIALRTRPEVQWIGSYQPFFRLAPLLRESAANPRGVSEVTIQLIAERGAEDVVAWMVARGLTPIRPPAAVLNLVNVAVRAQDTLLAQLAGDPFVFAIEPLLAESLLDEVQGQILAGSMNLFGNGPAGPGYLAWLAGKGFSATNQFGFVIDVTDDGVDRGSYSDVNTEFRFGGVPTAASRVVYNHGYTRDALTDSGRGHGNLNASIIGGYNAQTGFPFEDASGFNYGLGICPFVLIGNTKVFSNGNAAQFTGSSRTRLDLAWYSGARLSSNSWGYVSGNDYPSDAQAHDAIVRDARASTALNEELTILFAAGNSGPAANSVRPPATAKNVISVGASENYRPAGTDGCGIGAAGANDARDVASFSSRGPTADGRMKPDLVAPGTHVQGAASRSTSYNGSGVCNPYWPAGQTLYTWSSGTSHACPAAAGAAGLVRQFFINRGFGTPSPAMVKAVLMGTARHLTGADANDTLWSRNQGMGEVDLGRAFDGAALVRVDQSQIFGAAGQTFNLSGQVASSGAPFRVALVWTDRPGPTTGQAWVNDLDLEVSVGGASYRGNVFSGALSTAGGAKDPRNNAEFVFRPAGTTGPFSIVVRAANIMGDGVPGNADTTDQDFALLVYNGVAAAAPAGFSISAAPASRSITAGASASYAITASATGGFSSALSLAVSPAVPGVTWSFSPNPIAPNGSSTLTATTTASAPAGNHQVTVTATGGGTSRSVPVTLVIAAGSGSFTLSSNSASRTVNRTASTAFTIGTAASGGFSAPITLSVSPAITGVSFSFSPNPVAANGTSTLSVVTNTQSKAGTTTLTVTATGGGITRTLNLSLTIRDA